MDKTDKVILDVPTFIRLLELAREEVKTDVEIHYIAEKAIEISKQHPITMDDYNEIYNHAMGESKEKELENVKRLSGLQ